MNGLRIGIVLVFALLAGDVMAYGAVAWNDSTRKEGLSANYSNQNAADYAALEKCGGAGCKVVARFHNSCQGIAWSRQNGALGTASGGTRDEAHINAERECTLYSRGQICEASELCDGSDNRQANNDDNRRPSDEYSSNSKSGYGNNEDPYDNNRGGNGFSNSANPSGKNYNNCVQISDTKFDSCVGHSGMSMKITNVCNTKIAAEFCLERRDGKWDCGRESSMAPRESTTYFGCNSTGRYKWVGCEEFGGCQLNATLNR